MKKGIIKNISKILVILLVLSVFMGAPGISPVVEQVEAATVANGVTAYISGSTLTVTGTGSVPRAIPENAFAANGTFSERSKLSSVTNIVITGNIYEIGRYAFTGCVNASRLTINTSAKPMNIKLGAFYNCSKLTSVTIPGNVTHIQAGAFNTSKTLLSFQDSRMTKYTTSHPHGYKIYDTLTFNAIRNYDMAYNMLTEINKERTKYGASNLQMRTDLMEAAMIRAFEISLLFAHTRPNGEKFHTLTHHTKLIGENIATAGTVASAMSVMKKNNSDEADITNKSFKSIGVGCAQVNGKYFWVQIFSEETATGAVATKQTNKTASTAIDLPLGTNTVYVDGSTKNLGFKIDTGNTGLAIGNTKTLNLQLNGVSFARSSGKWTSDDAGIAKVSSDGKVTGVRKGTTIIRAGSTQTNRASIKVGVYERVRVAGNNRYGTSSAAADKVKSLKGSSKFDTIVVAYGDNFADALSATYLAAVKKAPIVLVNKSNESTVVNYVRSNLRSGGKVYLIGGTFVVSANLENALRSLNPVRLAGANRYGTNLAVLKEAGIAGKDVLICTGKNYADSLSASSVGKPIMLVGDSINQEQMNLLRTGRPSGKYYLIGGTFAVPQSIANQLSALGRTERVAGSNRFGTSIEVAKKFFGGKRDTVVLVYGMNYPDGLSGGPVAVLYDAPVILVGSINNKTKKYDPAGVPEAQAYAKSVGARRVVAVGGTAIIPDSTIDTVGGWV